MTSRRLGIVLIILASAAFLAGAYCWVIPDDFWWRLAGVILVPIAIPGFISGGRLLKRPDRPDATG